STRTASRSRSPCPRPATRRAGRSSSIRRPASPARSTRRRRKSRSTTTPWSCYGPPSDPAPAFFRPGTGSAQALRVPGGSLAAGQHGRDRGRRRVPERRHEGHLLRYRPAGLRAAPHAMRRHPGRASTVREEKYKPARPQELWSHLREGRPPTPPIAVVSRRLDLDPDSPLITAAPAHARTIVITTAQAPADRRAELARYADVIVAGDETVDMAAAVGALTKRGHRRMLAEGGPRLLAQLAEAGLLDELCLTIGPLIAGPGAPRIVAGTPGTGSV